MIERLVRAALGGRAVVLLLVFGLVVAGAVSYKNLDIEAYPNPVPPLVEVIAQPIGSSAEEVERYVTVPLEIAMAGMRGLDHVRSQSLFGLSDVKCYFKWGISYEQARQEVLNRLKYADLPDGVSPEISPWNAIGEVLRYELKAPGYSLTELKTAEDWILERQFKQVPGVVDVVSFGGLTKQYHVEVDPYRLRGENVTLDQLVTAVQNANQNVGGQRLVIGEQAFNVRGIGLIRTTKDIDDIAISAPHGTPIRVRDVARTEVGSAPRLGIVGHDDDPDVVQGTVLMRYGGETGPTLKGIHDRLDTIRENHLLPPGMSIVPYYDRGNLVAVTTHTVTENLIVGMALVTIVLIFFLGDVRAALVTALNIPLALLCAFCGMVGTGTAANLISLGAVDFGIVVDSTVIMTENIVRQVSEPAKTNLLETITRSAREVGGPMMFSSLIIATAFLPLFTMTGVSGVIFSPMALTYAFAIGGAILLALTLTPVLSSYVLKLGAEEKETPVMRALERCYRPFFRAVLARPRTAVTLSFIPVVMCGFALKFLGAEFMPKLEEGNLWIRATLPMSISLEKSSEYVGRMRGILRGCPADPMIACTDANRKHMVVQTVVSQLGRPDDGTDVAGFQNIELFAPLKPFDEWPRGYTKEQLTKELSTELNAAFPGADFNFSQMISDNVEEALSGIKGENSIKVIGPELDVNEGIAEKILGVMDRVPGVQDLGMFRTLGQPNLRIQIDREACDRYGLNTGDVGDVIQAAVGGQAITRVYEGERSFDLTVRWLDQFRNSVEAISRITVPAPDGSQVPLGQLAAITKEMGPSVIYREDGARYSPVKFSVRNRDLVSTIDDAKNRIASAVRVPYDTHLEWAGQINEYGDAMSRFMLIIPVTLVLIALLVYASMKNWLDTAIVLLSIPVACTGGIFALLLAGVNFSVSAAMGFVSIFGIAVQDAILVVTQFQRLREQGVPVADAACHAAEKRLRPVLMTTLVATLGLLPAALSTGIGSQTQKPLALVVIGGALILAVLNRAMQPPLLLLLHERKQRRLGDRYQPNVVEP
ncbi:MAG TPA: CusA/CzcA family heavy metal efflux RND transporter [Polyangiaceae bacterium]|nr:CusA/CzcA family heavy metal efflux RND transporter [Polyangiaceae bacterium]